jgi:hypothetical protein
MQTESEEKGAAKPHLLLRQGALSVVLFMGLLWTAAAAQEIRPLVVKAGAIVLDGLLSEPEWSRAIPAGEFVQFEPARGEKASFATEVRVLLASDRLYIGFFCRDPEPERIAAQLTRRDSDLFDDDCVGVSLDTFLDRRTAYFFFTNVLGTQEDGRLSDNGRTQDSTWDGEWRSAARRVEEGWTAEMEIPLVSIKFKPGLGIAWGFAVVRGIPRRLEKDTWPGPTEDIGRVSQFGTLVGLDLEAAAKRLELVPHVIGRLEEGRAGVETGADARWAFSQDFSANLTVNPDFATIEADQEQVNLTRFELSLPEKRNFFLEGSEIYNQRIQLFYSRRIADIWAGLKVYGKKSGTEIAVLSAQTKGDAEAGLDSANFSVLRLRQDIFKSSTFGFLAANRLEDGKNRGSAGLDVVHFFSEKFNFTGQLAASYGDRARPDIAFFLRPSYDSATAHFHLRYTQLGQGFGDNANAVGFISDDNRRELDSALDKTWWLKGGILERIEYNSNYNIYWGIKGPLRSWEVDQGLEIDLRNRFSLELGHCEEYKLYEKGFRNRQTAVEVGYNKREWQMARLSYTFGRSFGSDFRLWEAGLNRKLGDKFSAEYDLTRLILDPDPEGETTWIHVLRLNYFFTKDLFLKLFTQLNSSIDKKNIQLVFVWRFRPPFGLLQLAYQQGSIRFGERGEMRPAVFLKLAVVI